MTLGELLAGAARALPRSETPFLDASVLCAHAMGITRDELFTRMAERTEPPAAFSGFLERRAAGESVAYIVGRREFYGRDFAVDPRVLVPRPDTEALVEAALEYGDSFGPGRRVRVHDACTGSGAVGITIAAERPGWEVGASDISREALDLAAANAVAILGRPFDLALSDFMEGIAGPFDVITANPPYVASSETVSLLAGGWKEPALALDGGPDGLDAIRRLVPAAARLLAPGGFLLVEADGSQSDAVGGIFQSSGLAGIFRRTDLGGIQRVTGGSRPWTQR